MAGADITLQNNKKTKKLYPRTFLRNVYMDDGVTALPSILSGITTNSATSIQVTMDETNYIATINLLNEKGMIISTASLDLPLESMLIDCDYQDGKLIMMLQTGKIVEVEISEMINGLVHESRTINGKDLRSNIELTAEDVHALPADTQYVSSINGESGALDDIAKLEDLPTKISELENDLNLVTENRVSELIAGADVSIDLSDYSKVGHTHTEYAPLSHTHSIYSLTDHTHEGMATETFVQEEINKIPTPDVSGQINAHNTNTSAHQDIRDAIKNIDLSGYALIDHNHDEVYAPATHSHPYALEDHTHDYAASSHTHNDYLPLTAGEEKAITGNLYVKNSSGNGNIIVGNGSCLLGASTGNLAISPKAGGIIYLRPQGSTISTGALAIKNGVVYPAINNQVSLGDSSYTFDNIYGTTIYQDGKQVATLEDISIAGYDLEIVKDETNFKYTINLKDKAGNNLSSQTIDLPLESVVVNGSYSNGVLTLKLKNDEEISINISDIVSGLVPTTRKINGKPLSEDITLKASDVEALPASTSFVSSIDGKVGAVTGIAKTSDLPTITLNNAATTEPNFYAPTGAGTNNYILKSNGSGAPSWVAQDTIAANTAKTLATSRTINGTNFNGSSNIVTDYSYNISFDRITATSIYYAVFASIASSNISSNYGASFIVSGVGNTSDKNGSYLVEVGGRSGTPFIRAQEIVSGSSSMQFGYYLSGTTYYFGVKCPSAHSKISITVLNKDGVTTGALSNTTTAPSGWTVGTLTQFSISSHTHSYLPLTAGSSKALTAALYANKGIYMDNNNWLYLKDTEGAYKQAIGMTAANNIIINYNNSGNTLTHGAAFAPVSAGNKVTNLGVKDSNEWNNIYGTTIYEAGTALSSKYAAKSHNHVKADITDFDHTHNNYLPLDGSSRMTGVLKLQANMYDGNYALDCANSSITGVNSIYLADSDNGQGTEGLVSPRSDNTSKWDSISLYNGVAYLTTNMTSLQSGGGTRSQLATVNDTVANATKLNNQEASYYLNYNNFTNKPSIPTVTNYYWANVKIGSSSSTTTAPTFASVTLGSSGAKIAYNSSTQSIDFTF